jgi:hypothetical protein
MKTSKLRIHRMLAGMVLSAVLAVAGCAGHTVLVKPASAEKMIHYSELKGWDEAVNLNGYVIYVNEGDTIPLKISMQSDFMAFKQDRVDLVAKQKLYFMIKMPQELTAEKLARLNQMDFEHLSKMSRKQMSAFLKEYMLYVSKDARHWAPLYGSRAYRKVLGFKEGLIHFAVMAGTNDGLEANLGIETIK